MSNFHYGAGDRRYMFIDAACLKQNIHRVGQEYFDGDDPPIDWEKLAAGCQKVYYYDALPTAPQNKESKEDFEERRAKKKAELHRIQNLARFHVKTGETRRENKNRGNEQKMVDVQLAVDSLQMANRGIFSHVTIVTGDLDFLPLISALVDIGIDVEIFYTPKFTSEDLVGEADSAFPLTIHTIRNWFCDDFSKSEILPHFRISDPPSLDHVKNITNFMDEKYGHVIYFLDRGRYNVFLRNTPKIPNFRETSPSTGTYSCVNQDILQRYVHESFGLDLSVK